MVKEKSENVRIKHYIKSRGKSWGQALLSDCAITRDEAKAFEMYYYGEKDIGFIADTIGWSYSATQRHITKVALAIIELAQYRANSV